MNNQNITKPIEELSKNLIKAMPGVPLIMGNEALRFASGNFAKGGFTDTGFQKWRKRKNPNKWGEVKNPGRALLVDDGRLRNSGRVARTTKEGVALVWNVPYAKAHNKGINGIGTIQKVKAFSRSNGQQVKAHDRRVTQHLPKRQFIGRSQVLSQNVLRHSLAHINKHIK